MTNITFDHQNTSAVQQPVQPPQNELSAMESETQRVIGSAIHEMFMSAFSAIMEDKIYSSEEYRLRRDCLLSVCSSRLKQYISRLDDIAINTDALANLSLLPVMGDEYTPDAMFQPFQADISLDLKGLLSGQHVTRLTREVTTAL